MERFYDLYHNFLTFFYSPVTNQTIIPYCEIIV